MKRNSALVVVPVMMLCAGLSLAEVSDEEPDRRNLAKLERESHQWWLSRDTGALDKLMVEQYRFVAPNGALETKARIIGADPSVPRVLQIETLRMEPEEVIVRGNSAIVTGVIHMKATVGGRPAPGRLRVLSVFERGSAQQDWRLIARSTTPMLGPPDRIVAPTQ